MATFIRPARVDITESGGGSSLVFAISAGAAGLAVVVFVLAHLVLLAACSGVWCAGMVAALAATRRAGLRAPVHVTDREIAARLAAKGVPVAGRPALPAAEPAPAPWRVVSIEKVPRPDGGPLGVARGASEVGMNAPPTHGW